VSCREKPCRLRFKKIAHECEGHSRRSAYCIKYLSSKQFHHRSLIMSKKRSNPFKTHFGFHSIAGELFRNRDVRNSMSDALWLGAVFTSIISGTG